MREDRTRAFLADIIEAARRASETIQAKSCPPYLEKISLWSEAFANAHFR